MAEIETDNKFDCDECLRKRFDKRRDCEGAWDGEDISTRPQRIPIITAVPWMFLRRCPRALIEENPQAVDLWEDYQAFKATGHLPYAGGYKDQPAYLIEAFIYCKGLVSRVEGDSRWTKWYNDKRKKENRGIEDIQAEKEFNTLGDVQERRQRRRPRGHGKKRNPRS